MNPSLPQAVVDRAYERDPSVAAAEYGGEFRTDVEAFLNRDAIEACVSPGIYERGPCSGIRYSAFVDPSGGVRDSMTLAISHREDGMAVLDAVREVKPPFSPESVVKEFAQLLKTYGIHSICGDRYAGEWPREAFQNHDIDLQDGREDAQRSLRRLAATDQFTAP